VKLYDLPRRANPRPRIYCQPNGDPDGWVEFDHLDGMYSFCIAFGGDGRELGICHLKAWTPLEPSGDGYVIPDIE
jgi:hypothetical protein